MSANPFIALILSLLTAAVMAEPVTPGAQPPPKAGSAPSAREAALDRLLAARESQSALDRAIADARVQGVSEQAILEARFLYHIDRREDAAIVALVPAMLQQRAAFKLEDSAIFGVTEDWLAVVEYAQALAALGQGDKAGFKQHITEAFWLSPRQAAAFAPHIERLRLADCMRAVTLDLTNPLARLVSGDAVSLAQLAANHKALLLHFWSPRSRECEASLPDFIATAASLGSNNIAVASLLPADSQQLLSDARAMIHPFGEKLPGAWLLDSKDKPLARELRIGNLPTMVIVSTAGKILFNGDPAEDEFWETLRRIDASIKRPTALSQPAQ